MTVYNIPSRGGSLGASIDTSEIDDGTILPADMGAGHMTLISTQEVSGSAVTTISFTSLDIDTDDEYFMICRVKEGNGAGGATNSSIFVNGDTTATNYYSQKVAVDNATVANARNNNAIILIVNQSTTGFTTIHIALDPDDYFRASSTCQWKAAASVAQRNFYVVKTGTVANVTQLDMTTDNANGFAVGTTISLYKITRD